MQQCAEHVEYQLSNEPPCVSYLLEGIVCPDPGLQAAMASICTDDGPTGMRNDFEAAAAHILPYDSVAKKRAAAGSKRTAAQISLVVVPETAKLSLPQSLALGKLGYTYGIIPQRSTANSLMIRKASCESGGQIILVRMGSETIQTNKKPRKGFNKKEVSSAVARELRKPLAKGISEEKAEASDDGISTEAYIASMVEAAVNKVANLL